MKQPVISMKSTYKLIWSDEALINLRDIIDYLSNRWSEREVRKFAQLLDKQLRIIEENPFMFAESKNLKGYRKAVLSKQTSIYYKVSDQEIHLISVFDNRRKPLENSI